MLRKPLHDRRCGVGRHEHLPVEGSEDGRLHDEGVLVLCIDGGC